MKGRSLDEEADSLIQEIIHDAQVYEDYFFYPVRATKLAFHRKEEKEARGLFRQALDDYCRERAKAADSKMTTMYPKAVRDEVENAIITSIKQGEL